MMTLAEKAGDTLKTSRLVRRCWLPILSLALSGLAAAHHSAAMFDRNKTISIQGTVKIFEWRNPHAWLWISVAGKEGNPDGLWGLETAGPSMLNRMGITRTIFKPGDKVSVDLHPLVDGRTGGEFLKVTFADGKSIDVMERVRAFSSGN